MSVVPIVIVDNRQVSNAPFAVQSALLSYNNNVKTLLGKYMSLSTVHLWIKPIQVLLSAQSTEKTRLTLLPSVSQLHLVLDLHASCENSSNLIAVRTWSKYILDALMKCLNFIHHKRSKDKYSITMYATDLTLFGSSSSVSIAESLRKVFQCVRDIRWLTRVDVRIVCTVVCDTSEANCDNINLRDLQQMILVNMTSGGDKVLLHQTLNSTLHFDEELRHLVGQSAVPIPMTITFPSVFDAQCKCALQVIGATMSAMDALHSGMTDPEIWTMVPRSEVDPLHLEGKGLVVKSSTETDNNKLNRQNELLFRSLMNVLAKKDMLLVLKISNSRRETEEYWAMIPPATATYEKTPQQYHMVLVKLADRDSVVLDVLNLSPPNEVGVSNNDTDDTIEDDEMSSRPTDHKKSRDEDQLVLEETEEYLQQALFDSGTMPTPARFNPMLCESGATTHMYQDAMRKAHSALGSAAAKRGSTAAPVSAPLPTDNSVDLVESEEVNGITVQTKKTKRAETFEAVASPAKKGSRSKTKKLLQSKHSANEESNDDGFVPPSFLLSAPQKDLQATTDSKSRRGTGNTRGPMRAASVHAPPIPTTAASHSSSSAVTATMGSPTKSPKSVQQALSDAIRNANQVTSESGASREEEESDMYDQAALSSLASLTSLTPHQQQLARTLVQKQMVSPSAPSKFLKRKYAAAEGQKDMFQNAFY